jgi:hypothetical protein
VKVVRVIRCMDCGRKYRRTQDSSEDPAPCPQCGVPEPALPARISAPAIVGNKSRAVDAAWEIAQTDFGLTNMRDGAHEGETAFIPPVQPPADPRTIRSPQMLWGGAAPAGAAMPGVADTLAEARGAARLATAENRSPMQLLHRSRPKLQALPLNKGG